jgi:hypothetical protein
MLKRGLTYFVLALVVLQSAVAIGDAHQLHQSGAEHYVFDDAHLHVDEHATDNEHNHNLNSNLSAEKWDCHHCCHCHGHFSPAVLISAEDIHLATLSSPVPDYSDKAYPETFETFLRPPIA